DCKMKIDSSPTDAAIHGSRATGPDRSRSGPFCNLQFSMANLQSASARLLLILLAAACALAVPGRAAWAWWPAGHGILSKAAVLALPAEVPAFFRAGGAMIAHCSWDPDVEKNRATPQLDDAEGPEHYLDSELLKGRLLPATRYQFVQLCAEMK